MNDKWTVKSPIHLAAYVMWRLNWIHPFTDGNGRTSRALSYLVLCIRLKMLLPGRTTIPEQIEKDRTPYYKALEAADEAWAGDRIDLAAASRNACYAASRALRGVGVGRRVSPLDVGSAGERWAGAYTTHRAWGRHEWGTQKVCGPPSENVTGCNLLRRRPEFPIVLLEPRYRRFVSHAHLHELSQIGVRQNEQDLSWLGIVED